MSAPHDEKWDSAAKRRAKSDLAKQLQDDYRDLMRAAHDLCGQTDNDSYWHTLWDLCKDYNPTPK